MTASLSSSRNFNPRSPHGERRFSTPEGVAPLEKFQPTLPARGATARRRHITETLPISTHAPRTGSDLAQGYQINPATIFQPTLPARGATQAGGLARAVAGEISTHAPRTGSDHTTLSGSCCQPLFQPTLPARGATALPGRVSPTSAHFNPRSPHGERLPPAGGAGIVNHISTHAPRTGSDRLRGHEFRADDHFNPRSPHGERRFKRCWMTRCGDFNPRSPHGERRGAEMQHMTLEVISTHAPRTGSDENTECRSISPKRNFNPRSPHGERHARPCRTSAR